MIYLFILYGITLLSLSIFKTSELFLPAIYQFEAWLGGDKLMHLKLSIVLSILASIAAQKLTAKKALGLNIFWRLIAVHTCLGMGLLMDEAHQHLSSARRFEWMDFSYGLAGLSIGLSIYGGFWLLRRVMKCAIKRPIKHTPNHR